MGGNSPSTGGGGGGVGPAGLVTNKKTGKTRYGTAKDAKKVQSRNEFRKFISGGGVTGAIIRGIGEGAAKSNLKRRKEFIKKQGLTEEDINMSDDYLSSKEGLAELKQQGYTTASDVSNTGGGNDQNNQRNLEVSNESEGEAEGEEEAEEMPPSYANQELTDEEILLRNKRKGRKKTVLTSVTGDTSEAKLSKKTLLGG